MTESSERAGPAAAREGVSRRSGLALDVTAFEALPAGPRAGPSERHRISRWLGCWAGRSVE